MAQKYDSQTKAFSKANKYFSTTTLSIDSWRQKKVKKHP